MEGIIFLKIGSLKKFFLNTFLDFLKNEEFKN